jgi:hypothetical protein
VADAQNRPNKCTSCNVLSQKYHYLFDGHCLSDCPRSRYFDESPEGKKKDNATNGNVPLNDADPEVGTYPVQTYLTSGDGSLQETCTPCNKKSGCADCVGSPLSCITCGKDPAAPTNNQDLRFGLKN